MFTYDNPPATLVCIVRQNTVAYIENLFHQKSPSQLIHLTLQDPSANPKPHFLVADLLFPHALNKNIGSYYTCAIL